MLKGKYVCRSINAIGTLTKTKNDMISEPLLYFAIGSNYFCILLKFNEYGVSI